MQTVTTPTIGTSCSLLRGEIKAISVKVRQLKEQIVAVHPNTVAGVSDIPEMMANVTISYRHLEDAAMRLGKVIQAWDGGTSIYKE